ncbi:MAG: hypothetical protein GC180_08590 [Bacteroidetes bacterium]|nr:hypothetical protein [Bacteroidota bacterium]
MKPLLLIFTVAFVLSACHKNTQTVVLPFGTLDVKYQDSALTKDPTGAVIYFQYSQLIEDSRCGSSCPDGRATIELICNGIADTLTTYNSANVPYVPDELWVKQVHFELVDVVYDSAQYQGIASHSTAKIRISNGN